MKLALTVLVPAILAGGETIGLAQTYFYSGPISGYTEVDLAPDGGTGTGGSEVQFQSISVTMTYDAATQLLVENGSVTVTPGNVSFSISGSPFDNPYGTGSAAVMIGNNGTFSFDQTLLVGGGGVLPVPASGSATYAGQQYTGSWNIDIPLFLNIGAVSPTSLDFDEGTFQVANQANGGLGALSDGTSDGTYYASLTIEGTATAVPETNCSILLLGMALASLRLFRRL